MINGGVGAFSTDIWAGSYFGSALICALDYSVKYVENMRKKLQLFALCVCIFVQPKME